MKRIFFILTVMMAVNAFANTNCLGEAQIIAKVAGIQKKTLLNCRVQVGAVSTYNMNQNCPLDIDEVLSYGVEVGLKDGHDCALNSGDILTGIIVKDSAGRLVLE
jgi:hypothetical protein